MPTVIPVKFKYAARDLWFDPGGSGAQEADHVICPTERGLEIGLATADPREVTAEHLSDVIGHSQLKRIDRVATEGDLRHAEKLAEKGEQALPTFRRLVQESGLDMKPVGVEYLFGGEKVVCYFAAEERVDFRQLVRDLSHALHERIDMRQIGVREEAAIMGGYGHCGQELCCTRFGLQFEPVSIRMAKEQDLPLNSNKISGACGRLMCCLRYEFEAYRDFKGRAPKRNAVIETPLGKAKIVEYDTPKEEICLRVENGKQIRVPLAEMVASDAAKRKSEELGCPCRPDTVLRSTLDKLNSPDVQMALAELDRRMGVTPKQPTFDESDIFVDARPHRGGRGHGGGQASGGQQGQGAGQGGQPRRRRKTSPATQQQGGGNADATGATRTRRRHRKEAGEGQVRPTRQVPTRDDVRPVGEGAVTEASDQHGTRRRRHHRSANGEVTTQRQPQQQRPARQGQEGGSSARHMRHPGDHGGQSAGPAQGKRPTKGQPAQKAGGRETPEGSTAPKPRRRRHRGGRGHGSGSGQGGSGGTGPGAAPAAPPAGKDA